MADRDIIPDDHRILMRHMDDDGVLDVGSVTDMDAVDIASKHGIEPDTGRLAEDHLADQTGPLGDERR